jgi:hypothetical protein
MSYIGMGTVFDVTQGLFASVTASDELQCLNKANASPQVAAIDALIKNLAANWKPTGFYRPVDVQNLLTAFADQAAAAGAAIAAAPSSTGDAEQMKREAFSDMGRRYLDQSRNYERAVAQAKATGANVINAPGLKEWVLASMLSISSAYVTAYMLQCRQSFAEAVLLRAYGAMASVGAVAARILGVAVKVGEAAVDAVETTASLAAFVIRYAPYAALGIGGYMLYNMFVKKA